MVFFRTFSNLAVDVDAIGFDDEFPNPHKATHTTLNKDQQELEKSIACKGTQGKHIAMFSTPQQEISTSQRRNVNPNPTSEVHPKPHGTPDLHKAPHTTLDKDQ